MAAMLVNIILCPLAYWALWQVGVGQAFNVDVSMPIIFEDPGIGGRWNGRDSYFGFSVALHNYSSGNGTGQQRTYLFFVSHFAWVMQNYCKSLALLLVGAPRANNSNRGNPPDAIAGAKQPAIEPGALYKCTLWAETDGCTEIVVDSYENGHQFSQSDPVVFTYLKNNGWVGVALDAQPGQDGRVVVCGHLWKQQLLNVRNMEPEYFLPNGICYWMPAHALPMDRYDAVIGRLAPLMAPGMSFQIVEDNKADPPYQRTEYVYALGQAGATINLPRGNPKEIIMGAPGVFSWRGTAVRLRDGPSIEETTALMMNATTDSSANNDAVDDGMIGKLKQDPATETPFGNADVPQLIGTPNISIGDLWGYSVSSGVFTRDGQTMYLMTGPRAFFAGRAFIYDYPPPGAPEKAPLPVKWYFSGRQGGEYFGGSVCITDFNADGLDDVLIGAPLHSALNEGAVAPDQGKVYVYINNEESFRDIPDQELVGNRATGARFGYAISAVGDIDRDGFNDVAVGAPYENGQGAIYIYLGSKEGLTIAPQVIQASLLSPALKGFGVSISRGIDMDRNNYPDLAVGAFLSGHSVVLRSKPVIKISGTLKSSKSRISINDTTSQFHVEACLSYSGKEAPGTIEVHADVSADFAYAMPRVNFITGENPKTLSHTRVYRQLLTRGVENCERFALEFIPYVKDFSKALEIRLSYELVDSQMLQNSSDTNPTKPSSISRPPTAHRQTVDTRPVWITYGDKTGAADRVDRKKVALVDFCRSCAVADPRWPRQTKIAIPFLNDCGDDGCITDLSITASWVDIDISKPLVIGSKTAAIFAASVKAKLEPAFIPKATVHLPNHILLTSLPRNCVEDRQSDWTLVECELPGPMYAGQEATVYLGVDLSNMKAWMTELVISMAVQSISEERADTKGDNTFELILPLEAQADVAIRGESDREHFYYLTREDRPEKERGKANYFEVSQFFQITKFLPTPVDKIMAEFKFPVAVMGPPSLLKNSTVFLQVVLPQATSVQYSDHEVDCRLTDAETLEQLETTNKAPVKKRHGQSRQERTTVSNQEHSEMTTPHQFKSKKMFTQETFPETATDLPWRMKPSSSSEWSSRPGSGRSSNFEAATASDVTFVNCTGGSYKCQAVTCSITHFVHSGSSAQLGFKLKIDLSILEPWLGKNRTVVLVTQGAVRFGDDTADLGALQKTNKRPDTSQVVTVFTPVTQVAHKNVPTWVIAMSVAGGILLLLLITMGLMKAGFFNRSQLNKINQLRAEDELLRMVQQSRVDGDGDSLPPPPAEPSMIASSLEIVDPPIGDGSTDDLTENEH